MYCTEIDGKYDEDRWVMGSLCCARESYNLTIY